jgi:subtilisin family serine protease
MAFQFQELVERTPILWVLIVLLLLIILWLLLRRPRPTGPEVEYFIRDQIIITGPPEDIERVREIVEDNLGIELRLRRQPEPAEPEIDSDQAQAGLAQSAQEGIDEFRAAGNSVVNLYLIIRSGEGGQSITAVDVAAAINNLNEPGVVADANYKTGRAVISVAGDPDTGEGFSLDDIGAAAAETEFYRQWALLGTAPGGIALFKDAITDVDQVADVQNSRHVTATGKINQNERVLVAIFDTSPFDESEMLPDVTVDPSPPAGFDRKVSLVQHNALPGIPDARDHGVYAASLVNVVAPECEIQLIRVLTDSNQGTLEVLVEAIRKFIAGRESLAPNSAKPLANCVINLSLGVHVDPNQPLFNPPIPTLHNVLDEAVQKGAVIVAASGNDSANGAKPKQYPAAYPFVIDVGASNSQGQRACFSNTADIYAPGGECQSTSSPTPINDQEWIIGYAYYTAPGSHFAYWKGTSFAAPLVSGLAALLLSEGHNPAQIKHLLVSNALKNSTTAAVPVVHVPSLPLAPNP